MKVRVSYTIEINDLSRKAFAYYYGHKGDKKQRADIQTIKTFLEQEGRAAFENLVADYLSAKEEGYL